MKRISYHTSQFGYLVMMYLMPNMQDKHLSRHFYYFSQKTGFDISCKLSQMETICMKCRMSTSVFWKRQVSISSAYYRPSQDVNKWLPSDKLFSKVSSRNQNITDRWTRNVSIWHRCPRPEPSLTYTQEFCKKMKLKKGHMIGRLYPKPNLTYILWLYTCV